MPPGFFNGLLVRYRTVPREASNITSRAFFPWRAFWSETGWAYILCLVLNQQTNGAQQTNDASCRVMCVTGSSAEAARLGPDAARRDTRRTTPRRLRAVARRQWRSPE